jgi:outer membrane protein assembly factor BamB
MKVVASRILALVIFLSIALGGSQAAAAASSTDQTYALTRTIKLGGDGGWDYVTLDAAGKLLYATRTTHTMVIDAATGKVVHDIPGTARAHGVALVPDVGRGFISDGKGASVLVLDLNTGATLGKVPAAEDADGIIYDPATKKVIVMCGDAHQMIALAPDAEPKSGTASRTVDLGGSPEFAVADGKGRVFVNIEDKDEVAVVDTNAMKVIARWPLGGGKHPTGMSMDPVSRRLFVGCRNGKLVIMSADDGKIVADFPIGAYVDATAFDNGLVFASCGDGTLTVVREISPDKFELAQTVKTEIGARTMAVDHADGTIYLPTSDLILPPPPSAENPHPRPVPVAGTFRILVVTRGGAH